MPFSKGVVVKNRYEINGVLARGGMGIIYKGYDRRYKLEVAIKENFLRLPQNIRQFERESHILGRLKHPSLPRKIDHFSMENNQLLVMEFIEGRDLWEILKDYQYPLSETQSLSYIMQICDAVGYLHQQAPPIIHRDIKPQNIKITPDNRAILVDFGISKISEVNASTITGAQGVTTGFSPVEQYSGQGTTEKSDLYSLGATLYTLLTGEVPPDSFRRQAARVICPPAHELNPYVSTPVSQAIQHALALEAEDRPDSVLAWREQLRAAQRTSRPVKKPQAAPKQPRAPLLISSKGEHHQLKPGQFILGRSIKCDIQVNDHQVSRQHALLKYDGRQCFVYDNNSGNGTFVNDERVTAKGRTLRAGDRLWLGKTYLTLSYPNSAESTDVEKTWLNPRG